MTYILYVIVFLSVLLLALFKLGFFYATLYLAYFVLVFCVVALILLISHFYRVAIGGNAPYIRTGKKLISRVLEEIDFKDNAKVYELGCGDGRFLRALAKGRKVRAVGYESFILPYCLARIFNFFTHSTAKIFFKDLFKADLSDADYIFCYLIPDQMDKLEIKLQKELKPGALVISNTFKFKNWQPEKEIILNVKNKIGLSNKLNLYRR